MGKPGFPSPLRAGCALPNPPLGRSLGARASGPHPQSMGKPGFPIPLRAGCALPNPPLGRSLGARASGPHPQSMGKPGFPSPLRAGCALPNPPLGRSPGARAQLAQTLPRGGSFTSCQWRIRERKSFVRSCCGALKSASGGPCSMIRP